VQPLSEQRKNFEGSDNKQLSQVVAFYQIKHRMQMVTPYQYVESYNLVVWGYDNKTERMVEFFVLQR